MSKMDYRVVWLVARSTVERIFWEDIDHVDESGYFERSKTGLYAFCRLRGTNRYVRAAKLVKV